MLHPRNAFVSTLLYGSYGMAAMHGVAIALLPPVSLVPVIGELNVVWGIAAIMGAVSGIFGYSRGQAGRLVEASGMALMAWAFTTYAITAITSLLVVGDPSNRGTQITALASLVLLCWARAATLLVLWGRDRKKIKALRRAVMAINGTR